MNKKISKGHRRNDFPVDDFKGWTQEYLTENNYMTGEMLPENVSAFHNDSGYISVIPFVPTKLSELINDPGFLLSAPVISVNGQTGAVALALFSGAYADLTGKPALFSGVYADLTGKPSLFSGSYLDLTDKPTIPIVRRSETYSGVTDASGNFSVVYSTPFPAVPHVTPVIIGGTPSQVARVTASTTSGCTINVTNRASVTLLAIEVLLAATTPVAGAAVSVSVLARA